MKTTPITAHLATLIDLALGEDLGTGDLTSQALPNREQKAVANFVAREPLVVSGLSVAALVFTRLDPSCQIKAQVAEGSRVKKGAVLARVEGPLGSLLSAERCALNFLRHLSGIATLTRRYHQTLSGTGCTLLDTRKTTPGFRALEKAAVRAGGGANHRMGLFDGVMIKDNHIAASQSIRQAVSAARKQIPPTVKIEVECDNLKQVRAALAAGAELIMLDNMSHAQMRKAVALIAGRAQTEASGNLTLATVRAAAECGVDFVSVGALTHSAPNADIALDLQGS